MFREGIPARQLSAWACAALIPVVIQLGSGSWLWAGVTAVVCTVAVWAVWRWGVQRSRVICVLRCAFLIIVIGELASRSAGSWPGDNDPAVPLMLLALAAWSAQKGPSAAARVGCVLFWFVIIMYLVVFGAGIRDVELRWLAPEWGDMDWEMVALLLTPAAAAVLLRQKEGWVPRLVLPGVFAVCAALLTAGVLSPGVALRMENAFYEMSRSMDLLGVAKRFEAVVSAGMTVGWFAILSLYLTVFGRLAEQLRAGWGRPGVWLAAAGGAGWVLCDLHISAFWMAILATIFWVVTPVLEQGIALEKKS